MIHAAAPIKRMSILERREKDSRAYFSRHWGEVHGGMVSRMPHLFAYIQNHVVEDFVAPQAHIRGDGVVEQLWRSTADMQKGYNSAVVPELIADEVNYLGHGSNYAILAQGALRQAPDGNKLMVAFRHGGDVSLADAAARLASELCADMMRDDVIATIAKPNFLPVPPQPVDMFLHLYASDAETARQTGRRLADGLSALALSDKGAFAVWRMTTKVIVAP